jgi:hypothetical protein
MQFSLFYLKLICIYLKSIFSEHKNKCKITLKTISSKFDCILSKLFRVWIQYFRPLFTRRKYCSLDIGLFDHIHSKSISCKSLQFFSDDLAGVQLGEGFPQKTNRPPMLSPPSFNPTPDRAY